MTSEQIILMRALSLSLAQSGRTVSNDELACVIACELVPYEGDPSAGVGSAAAREVNALVDRCARMGGWAMGSAISEILESQRQSRPGVAYVG